MSLKRLHEAVKSLIRHHIDEHGRLSCGGSVMSEKSQHGEMLSRWSDMLKKAYELSGFSATFLDDNYADERAMQILQKMGCFQGYAEFVEIPTRVAMSDGSDIVGKSHTQPFMQELSPATIHGLSKQDLQYLLRAIKKHYDLVGDDDITHAVDEYKVLLQDKQAAAVEVKTDAVYAQLQECCADGALIFADTFINVLCQQYLKPLMMERGITRENASWLTQGMKSNMAMALSAPISRINLSHIIGQAVHDVLHSIAYDKSATREIVAKIKYVVASSQDAYQLLQLGMDGIGTGAGEFAAHQVLHKLPKLNRAPEEDMGDIVLPAIFRQPVVC